MKLTRMALDMTKRKTMYALSSPNIFHGIVESSFPGERKRNLWRIDQLRGTTYLLILSEDEPNLTQAVQEIGIDGSTWESRDYTPLLNRITEDSVWQFRLCANPTYSEKRQGERGKVHAHRTPEHQMEWLMQQGEKHGFQMTKDSSAVTESRLYHFIKGSGGRKEVELLSVTYEGLLTVTDAEQFKSVLQNGLGRGKAYGMGLLTVIRGDKL